MAVSKGRQINQGAYIGAGLGTMDEVTLSYPGQLGDVLVRNGIAYQLVQFKSTSTTIAAAAAVGWTDLDDFVVSAKASDWLGRNFPAGLALGTQTAGSYGWIQVNGPGSARDDGGNAASGTSLILSATDGTVGNVAAGTASTYAPLAIATAAASGAGGTIACEVIAPHNCW